MVILALVPLLSFMAYSALAYTALRHKPRKKVHQTFLVYLLAVASWAAFAFLLYTNLLPEKVDLLSALLLISTSFAVVAYYHFLRAFMQKPGGIGVFVAYAILVALIPVIMQKQVVYVIRSPALGMIPEIEYTMVGLSTIALGSSVLIGWAAVALIQHYLHSADPLERNRITYFLVGFALMALLGFTKLHPVLTRYPLAHLGNLANAVLITYAIAKYHLLDIHLVVRKGLVYAITGAYCTIFYLAMILGILQPLQLQASYALLIVGTGVTLLVAILFHPAQNLIQEWLERLSYGERYDYRRLLLTFTSRVGNVLDLGGLAEYMLDLLNKGLHAEEATLFLPENDGGDFLPRFTSLTGEDDHRLTLAKDNPIVTWLAREGKPFSRKQIDIVPQMKSLWEKEGKQLQNSKMELFFPIKNKGALIGILAIGKKMPRGHYRSEDLDLVMTVTNQAGVVIENAQLYAAAKMRANTDELTGLFNHRYFHERLEEEINRGLRFGVIFSLIFLDLDLFKQYNDIHGHLAGDEALRQIGQAIRNSLRTVDVAFRYGGDEFAIILSGTSATNAYQTAERIRKNIEEAMSSRGILLTCSLGIASWPADGIMREALIQYADSALYQAKRWGNQTCSAAEATTAKTPVTEASAKAKQGTLSTIYALAATVDARDHYTYGHSRRVSNYAMAIGEAMGLPPERTAVLQTAGLLHDIGKIGISDDILNKPALLNEEEWKPVHSHPALGVSILKHIDSLADCLPGIQYHHERYDGTGYPSGLKGNNIPLDARIIAVADAYEAMTSPRPYRHRILTLGESISELQRNAETQFDPELVRVFTDILKQDSLVGVETA